MCVVPRLNAMDPEDNPYVPPNSVNLRMANNATPERMSCPNCNHPEAVFWHYVVPGSTRCSNCGARVRLRLPGILRRFDWNAIALLAVFAILCGYFAPFVVLETTVLLWLLILVADVTLNVRLGYLELAFPERDL